MPVKAASVTPVKKVLELSDDTKDTWVFVRPVSYRDDIIRGELLRDSKMVASAMGMARAPGVNPYGLKAEELWITFPTKEEMNGAPACHIVVQEEDGDGNITTREPFTWKDEMTRVKFIAELGKLDPIVVLEWYDRHIEVNEGWTYPF